MSRFSIPCLSIVLLLVALPCASLAADSEAAEHQYRVARRLLAEGAPTSAAALAKVVELDPLGPLADDALIEQALLLGVAHWPEELGRISAESATLATLLVRRIVNEFGRADRAAEAGYYLALLLLEPLAQHDQDAARMELVSLAAGAGDTEWSRRAQYAGTWLADMRGMHDRARSACERLYIDQPVGEVAARARVGRARIALMDGDHGLAAHLLQTAIDAGVPPDVGAHALRPLAVSYLQPRTGERLSVRANTGIRSISGFAPTPSGGVLVGDRRAGRVIEFDRDGRSVRSWEVKSPQALAVNLPGRMFVAADTSIFTLVEGQAPRMVAQLGDFAPVSDMTADDAGRLWVIDRQGARIGLVSPGATEPVSIYEGDRVSGIDWDGHRLIVLDAREKSLLALSPDGSMKAIEASGLQRPVALAADRAGRLAVLDTRAGAVVLLNPDGSHVNSIGYRDAGVLKPAMPVFSMDGRLHLLDESSGSWITLP